MINYDYLYDKTHYDKYTQVTHFSDEYLSWKIYDNATVFPYVRGYSEVVGGLVDSDGNYIDGSGLQRGMGNTYKYNKREAKFIDETIVFLGIWPNIWGHWLTDNIRRLWVLKNKEFMSKYGNCKFVYLPYRHQNIGKNPKDLLDVFSIENIKLEAEEEITEYKRVILPDECFFRGPDSNRYYSKEYVDMINDIRSFAEKGFKDTGIRKVYFTYKDYSIIRSVCENRLEKFFKSIGFEIISPEEYTFREQMNILLSCSEFASTVGSAAHNILFLKDKTKVYLIPRTDFITEYQFALDEICDLDIIYVDSSLSLYTHPEHPWGGPFYYIISDNLLKLFDKRMQNRNNKKGFLFYRQLGLWLNGHRKISEYYKEEYKKYFDIPIEKTENVSKLFRICEDHNIQKVVAKILLKSESIYARIRRDYR